MSSYSEIQKDVEALKEHLVFLELNYKNHIANGKQRLAVIVWSLIKETKEKISSFKKMLKKLKTNLKHSKFK